MTANGIKRALRNGNHWGTYRNYRECQPWFALGPVKSGGIVGVDIAVNGRGLWVAPWWWIKKGRGIKLWLRRLLTRERTII